MFYLRVHVILFLDFDQQNYTVKEMFLVERVLYVFSNFSERPKEIH